LFEIEFLSLLWFLSLIGGAKARPRELAANPIFSCYIGASMTKPSLDSITTPKKS